MSEAHLKWDQEPPNALFWVRIVPQSGLKLSPYEIVYGRRFQVFVLGTPPLDLEHESKIKQYVQHLGKTTLHKFAHCRSTHLSDEPFHPFQLGDRVY